MISPVYLTTFETDLLGLVGVAISQIGLLRLQMFQEDPGSFYKQNIQYQEGVYSYSESETQHIVDQIQDYLGKKIFRFDIQIDWTIYTDFQKAVLKETNRIPYGETRSYGEIAAAIGKPKASRAVGQAEKSNQVPLVVPCHRVIGADGSLTGYGGKAHTDIKERILAFEQNKL
jgi:methylated-DNA-[protein]-cysteine S-methyltransferase